MKEVYNKLTELTKEIERVNYNNEVTLLELKATLRNYIETHFFGLDEIGEDLLRLINGNYERCCRHCSKPMTSGYCIDDGCEYYCSDECLHEVYSDEEYQEMYDNDTAYWTEWEDECDDV